MRLSLTILSNVLFVTAILALPQGSVYRRAPRAGRSHPLSPIGATQTVNEPYSNASHIQYSSNWAGAVLTAPPAGQTFNTVSGRFTIPTPSAPTSGSGSWSASAWVGIDGDTYQNAILQTGCDFTVRVSGGSTSHSYACWYEWLPNGAYNFANFAVTAGNVIQATVHSTSSSTGTATLDNISTGKSVSINLSAPSSGSHLAGQNAEWIVEDYEQNGSLVPLANFDTITFTGASAGTSSGNGGHFGDDHYRD